MHGLKVYALVLPIFLVIDLLWLGVLMKGFYNQELGDLARRDGASLAPRWIPAFLVYLLIPGGIVLLVRPLLGENASLWQALGWGALYGLIVYGVYDLTNLAVIEKWTLRMTLTDIVWGCAICGTTSVAMRLIDNWLSR
jgi:uncharacterized membrane protein